jgi:tripartite-type tricarboxylate transporter receptor subunit TctC
VQLIVLAIPSAAPFMQNGSLRPLAISAKQRAPGYENIPPVAETFPGFDFGGWSPNGTRAEIVQRMNRELDDVLKQAEIVQRLQEIGFYATGAGTTQVNTRVFDLRVRWAEPGFAPAGAAQFL